MARAKTERTLITRLEEEEITEIHCGYRHFKLSLKRGIIEEGHKCQGLTDFDEGVITLERSNNHETVRETLLHELVHVVLEVSGLGDDEDGKPTHVNNEELTTRVSRGLLLLMNLNPELFSILNERQETEPS